MPANFEILKDSCNIGVIEIKTNVTTFVTAFPNTKEKRDIQHSPGILLIDIHDHSKADFLIANPRSEYGSTTQPVLNLLVALGRDAYFYEGYQESNTDIIINWTLFDPNVHNYKIETSTLDIALASFLFPNLPPATFEIINKACNNINYAFIKRIKLEQENKEKYLQDNFIPKTLDLLSIFDPPSFIRDLEKITNTYGDPISKLKNFRRLLIEELEELDSKPDNKHPLNYLIKRNKNPYETSFEEIVRKPKKGFDPDWFTK